MRYAKSLFLLGLLLLCSCSAYNLKSSEAKNERSDQSQNQWSDWFIFPVKNIIENTAIIRNDYLLYRVKNDGFTKDHSAFKYTVQFRNTRNELVRIKYNMFSKFEKCNDLELIIGPNKDSQFIAHLFEESAPMFIQLKKYTKLINNEYLLGSTN